MYTIAGSFYPESSFGSGMVDHLGHAEAISCPVNATCMLCRGNLDFYPVKIHTYLDGILKIMTHELCKEETETLKHLFCDCSSVKNMARNRSLVVTKDFAKGYTCS